MKLPTWQMGLTNDAWWYLIEFLDDDTLGNLMCAFPCLRAFVLPRIDLSGRSLHWVQNIHGAAKYLLENRTLLVVPKMVAWLPLRATKLLIGRKKLTATTSLVAHALLCGRKEVCRFFLDRYTRVHREYTASGGSEEYWESIVEHPSMILRLKFEEYLVDAVRSGDEELTKALIEYLPVRTDNVTSTFRMLAYRTFDQQSRPVDVSLILARGKHALLRIVHDGDDGVVITSEV